QARELDLTKAQREQVERMLAIARQGAHLHMGVDLGMDPARLQKLYQGFAFLRRGIGTNMADINRVTERNMRLIRSTMGTNTAEGRKAASENMRATAHAIEAQMQRSGDKTQAGMERVRK